MALALGDHPKTVQSVMRHSTITLTMDSYGHLLPGAEAEAADKLGAMISLSAGSGDDSENAVRVPLCVDGDRRG